MRQETMQIGDMASAFLGPVVRMDKEFICYLNDNSLQLILAVKEIEKYKNNPLDVFLHKPKLTNNLGKLYSENTDMFNYQINM